MISSINLKRLHCYASSDIFKIATATKVLEFNLGSFDDDREILGYYEKEDQFYVKII